MNTTEGGKKSDESSSPIEEDKKSSNAHCIAYLVKDRSKVIKIFNATVEGLRSSFLYIILSICSIFTLVCFCRSREWMI
jgi:hypothetical protein